MEENGNKHSTSKIQCNDIVAWLSKFDACALANGWKDDNRIKTLPTFLRGQAATHFYTIPDEERETYAATTRKLKESLCPPVERESYYVKFEARTLCAGEDTSIYKWELEQLLEKAAPTLGDEAKATLLSCQFVHGLPSNMSGKLLGHNPTRNLTEMLNSVQHYRAVEEQTQIYQPKYGTTTYRCKQ